MRRVRKFQRTAPEAIRWGCAPLNSATGRKLDDGTVIPWIDENLNLFTGDWISRTLILQRRGRPEERGKDYNHSPFCDLVISGLVGLRPRADDTVEAHPLAPESWDYFRLDRVRYHGHWLTILWDKTGGRYHRGQGLRVFCDGRLIASSPVLQQVSGPLNAPVSGPGG